MARLVSIPEETLAQLLREAGRTETVQQYLESGIDKQQLKLAMRFHRRARAAYWSQYWLLFSAVVTWIGLFFGPDFEGVLAAVLLTGMTVAEHYVEILFKKGDDRAITLGWWNQCLFAFLFIVWGVYHGAWQPVPPSVSEATDAFGGTSLTSEAGALGTLFYYLVGLVGGGGQFSLACYYALTKRI